jgi:hypothetical protein
MATVCTDLLSQEGFFVPCAVKDAIFPAYALLVRGVYFRAFMSPDMPGDFRRNCCVTSARCPIFVRNCEKETLDTWKKLAARSKPVGALAR